MLNDIIYCVILIIAWYSIYYSWRMRKKVTLINQAISLSILSMQKELQNGNDFIDACDKRTREAFNLVDLLNDRCDFLMHENNQIKQQLTAYQKEFPDFMLSEFYPKPQAFVLRTDAEPKESL